MHEMVSKINARVRLRLEIHICCVLENEFFDVRALTHKRTRIDSIAETRKRKTLKMGGINKCPSWMKLCVRCTWSEKLSSHNLIQEPTKPTVNTIHRLRVAPRPRADRHTDARFYPPPPPPQSHHQPSRYRLYNPFSALRVGVRARVPSSSFSRLRQYMRTYEHAHTAVRTRARAL